MSRLTSQEPCPRASRICEWWPGIYIEEHGENFIIEINCPGSQLNNVCTKYAKNIFMIEEYF